MLGIGYGIFGPDALLDRLLSDAFIVTESEHFSNRWSETEMLHLTHSGYRCLELKCLPDTF